MSLKLKALGLAVFAALAVGAVSVVSAAADEGGVAHSDVDWTHITGKQEGSLHENALVDHDEEDAVTCSTANFTASVAGKTQTEITVTPTYAGCETTENEYPTTVNMNGCTYTLTFTDDPAQKHHTVHLGCPAGKTVKISVNPPFVGECHTYIPPQTPTTGGVTYTTHTIEEKHATETTHLHALTLDITIEGITNTKEETGFGCAGGGGHSQNSTLKGTVTVEGKDTDGKLTNITVTTAKE
jgi:hypothetical protein